MRRTKIVCTVGPASQSADKLQQLLVAGTDVFRLNFSHGSVEAHQATARRIRAIAATLGKPVAILQDLPGPKIRIGAFQHGTIQLSPGEPFTLTMANVPGDQQHVAVNYPALANEVQPGQSLLLADGMIELRIETVSPPDIHCRVLLGGPLSDHKGISVPRGVLSSIAAFTEQDQAHLLAGLAVGVDLAAISFVRSAHDIAAARRFLDTHHAALPLMAKIEKPEAVDALDEILAAADSVMVARGDLGVEIPLAEVPLVQKDIIRAAIQAAKPVITATQMLRSMVDSPRPTRAEAADVANAVLDGTDAVMLSEESAVGAYPVEAVRILAQIAETAETRLFSQPQSSVTSSALPSNPSTALGHAACVLAREAGAAAIVCCTRTGRSAQLVAKYRPAVPIIAVSPSAQTVQRLCLTWGVRPVLSAQFDSIDRLPDVILAAAQSTGLVTARDRIVLVGAAPSTPLGHTDFLRLISVPSQPAGGVS